MAEEEYFSYTNICISRYKKISTPVPVPKRWLVFSYIRSEYYKLNMNFYIIEEEDYLPDTKCFVVKYKRKSSPTSVPTHWI